MQFRPMFRGGVFSTVLLGLLGAANADDGVGIGWRNDGTGQFPDANPPLTWSPDENIVWKTELPGRSLASPIVVGERIFVLAEPTELVCLSTSDGAIVWQKPHAYSNVFGDEKGAAIEDGLAQAREIQNRIDELHRRRREAEKAGDESLKESFQPLIRALEADRNKLTETYHQLPSGEAGNTGGTPASDGQNVYALFGTGVVSSHTISGKRNWMTFVAGSTGDQSASPTLAEGKLVIHLRELHALDAATGEVLWTAEVDQRHGSPVVARVGDASVVVTPGGAVVRLDDGEVLARNLFRLGHSSPIVHDGIVYAMEDGATKAIKLSAEKDDCQTLWESPGSRTNRLASPLYCDGLLYCVNEQGVLEVYDAKSGDRVYRKRLSFSGGRLDPSLCLAGGRLYITSNQGMTIVIRPGRQYEELSQNELRENFSSSPALAADRIYFRTRKHAICVGK